MGFALYLASYPEISRTDERKFSDNIPQSLIKKYAVWFLEDKNSFPWKRTISRLLETHQYYSWVEIQVFVRQNKIIQGKALPPQTKFVYLIDLGLQPFQRIFHSDNGWQRGNIIRENKIRQLCWHPVFCSIFYNIFRLVHACSEYHHQYADRHKQGYCQWHIYIINNFVIIDINIPTRPNAKNFYTVHLENFTTTDHRVKPQFAQ